MIFSIITLNQLSVSVNILTDTDSWTYEIEAEDVYQDFWKTKINLTMVTIQKTLYVWRDKQKGWCKIQR